MLYTKEVKTVFVKEGNVQREGHGVNIDAVNTCVKTANKTYLTAGVLATPYQVFPSICDIYRHNNFYSVIHS